MQNKVLTYFKSFYVVIFLTVFTTQARGQDCGQEELVRCSKPLQVGVVTSELNKLCPDLHAGINCIRSYTRRCMTLKQREQFMKIYRGTEEVIRDLCREGDYQNEFLRHSPCLQKVRPQHEMCGLEYQKTMSSIINSNHTTHHTSTQNNHHHHPHQDHRVKNICCSFRDYLDCSEHVTRRVCGSETGTFIRQFLNKMSATLEKEYCDQYYHGADQCPNTISGAFSYLHQTIQRSMLTITLPTVLLIIQSLHSRMQHH